MYTNLKSSLRENKIKLGYLAKVMKIDQKTLYNKLTGATEFTKTEFDFIYKNYLSNYDYWWLSERND